MTSSPTAKKKKKRLNFTPLNSRPQKNKKIRQPSFNHEGEGKRGRLEGFEAEGGKKMKKARFFFHQRPRRSTCVMAVASTPDCRWKRRGVALPGPPRQNKKK